MILMLWVSSQIVVLLGLVYAVIKESDGLDWEKVALILAMSVFGPLTLSAIFAAIIYMHVEDGLRQRCALAINKWEATARKSSQAKQWGWYMDKECQEERFNLLRSCIRTVSDDDIDLLSKVGETTYSIDKPLREAIVDELIERRILSNE